jgi:hypothetical protein
MPKRRRVIHVTTSLIVGGFDMTNNTQLKPCPFCGTDDDIDPAGVLNGDGTTSPECMGCGATAPTIETWNCRITTPAEDVRAVGEERGEGVDFGFDGRSVRVSQEAYSIFLAREQMVKEQRPVVLPERNNAKLNLDLEQCGYVDGWNACLDAVEELNK